MSNLLQRNETTSFYYLNYKILAKTMSFVNTQTKEKSKPKISLSIQIVPTTKLISN